MIFLGTRLGQVLKTLQLQQPDDFLGLFSLPQNASSWADNMSVVKRMSLKDRSMEPSDLISFDSVKKQWMCLLCVISCLYLFKCYGGHIFYFHSAHQKVLKSPRTSNTFVNSSALLNTSALLHMSWQHLVQVKLRTEDMLELCFKAVCC